MPTYPALAIGQRLTAALLTSMLPVQVKKASGTSRASTTTLAADPELVLPVEANASYRVIIALKYEGGNASGSLGRFKWSPTGPAGATGDFTLQGPQAAGNVFASDQSGTMGLGQTFSMGAGGAGVAFGLLAIGTLIVAGTAGNFTITWAQADSNATPTIVYAGSYIEIQRIA